MQWKTRRCDGLDQGTLHNIICKVPNDKHFTCSVVIFHLSNPQIPTYLDATFYCTANVPGLSGNLLAVLTAELERHKMKTLYKTPFVLIILHVIHMQRSKHIRLWSAALIFCVVVKIGLLFVGCSRTDRKGDFGLERGRRETLGKAPYFLYY